MAQTELLDPLRAHQVREIEISCANSPGTKVMEELENLDPKRFGNMLQGLAGGIMVQTNIAHIPISIKYFQEWFVNNVVRPQKETYPLLKFIKDMCSGLIGKSFGNICFSKNLPTQVKFDTSIFTQSGLTRLGKKHGEIDLALFKKSIDAGRTASAKKTSTNITTSPALVLYSADSKPNAIGNRNEDHRNGIYHYAMGARCGLAKKISFNRVDQPYLREARIARVGALGAEQLRELYTVDLDMVGNTLHKNGQYLYIEPITIGSNAGDGALNLAQRLGFGGYYLITSVASSVSDVGFDVQVSALQEGIKFGSASTSGKLKSFSGTNFVWTGLGDPPNVP